MTTALGGNVVYELSDAQISRDDRVLLDAFSLEIQDRAATVILGPAGTGKSSLLHALSGRSLPSSVVLSGAWRVRGNELHVASAPLLDVALCEQRKGRVILEGAPPPWRETLASGASILLLDEPTRGCSESEVDELVEDLARHTSRGSAIVVTHDIAFARRVADYVCFFVAGKLNVHGRAVEVFRDPPTRVFERFLSQGNCWPSVPPPSVPPHFRWLLPRRLAGMACPGLLTDVESDLTAIAFAGIQVLVTLTEEPFSQDQLRAFGIQGRHLPIRDMDVPAVGPAARLCRSIERSLGEGRPVAIHCRAGVGRTGTMLAACLVWMGSEADAAIAQVRALSPGYIQNRQQELFVHRFKESV